MNCHGLSGVTRCDCCFLYALWQAQKGARCLTLTIFLPFYLFILDIKRFRTSDMKNIILSVSVLLFSALQLSSAAPGISPWRLIEETASDVAVPADKVGFGSSLWRRVRAAVLRTKAADRFIGTFASRPVGTPGSSGRWFVPEEQALGPLANGRRRPLDADQRAADQKARARTRLDSRSKRPQRESGTAKQLKERLEDSQPEPSTSTTVTRTRGGGKSWEDSMPRFLLWRKKSSPSKTKLIRERAVIDA